MDFAHFDPEWPHLCPGISRGNTGMSHMNPPEPMREMPEPLQAFTQANGL